MGKNSKNWQKSYDAKRMRKQSARGHLWSNNHPGYDAERMRKTRQTFGRSPRFMIDAAFNPLIVKSKRVIVAGDWHIPFQDSVFCNKMIKFAEQEDIRDIIIPGDFWDCDNYSRFVKLCWDNTFAQEKENVAEWLGILREHFDNIAFCRGNHEKRWIDMNAGRMGMEELFATTQITDGYEVTLDDHIILNSKGHKWLVSHPRNFRQANLSVGRDLAAKYHCNVFVAHGHQWAQGTDRSGRYVVLDGGGMFDAGALEYLRNTTCYPAVQGGFYVLRGNEYEAYMNKDGASTRDFVGDKKV